MMKSAARIMPQAIVAIALGFVLALVPAMAQAAQTPAAADGRATLVAAQAAGATSQVTAQEATFPAVTVKARARVQDAGWKKWVAEGKTAGTITVKGLRSIQLKLDGLDGLGGSIKYSTYDMSYGWNSAVANGKTSGRPTKAIQAVKIWLTGNVSKHYDVLYRAYVRGKGWQPWVKNKGIAGSLAGYNYTTAVQVKLTAKSQEAAGNGATAPGARYEARLLSSGWQAWTGDGKTAGKASKSKKLDGFALDLNLGSLEGGVKYRGFVQGKQWKQGWKTSGQVVGVAGKRLEALQMKLTGAVAKKYDLYYRTYVGGYGWLDWAKNGQTSGSTSMDVAISGVQVKLVKKGQTVKGAGPETTANDKKQLLSGIDIASWQASLNVSNVKADFVIVKATGGTRYTNPQFKGQANAALKSGKLLGLYHFAREASCPGTAAREADHFIEAAGPYIGQAVLVLDWEAGALLSGPSWAKKFLDRVYKKTGVRPLIYMSKSVTSAYNWSKVASDYELWVAQYKNYSRMGYTTNPWRDNYNYGYWDGPTMFQYTSAGRLSGYKGNLDLDLFYGTASAWRELATPAK